MILELMPSFILHLATPSKHIAIYVILVLSEDLEDIEDDVFL